MNRHEAQAVTAARATIVLDECDTCLDTVVTTPAQRETVGLALCLGRLQVAAAPHAALLQLPLAVHEALTGDWRPAIPVAAACHLLYLGADLLDDVADHELPPPWDGWGPEQAVLTACSLIYPLSQLAASRARASPGLRLAILERLAEGARAMAAGQQEELQRSVGDDVDPDAALRTAASKSGAEGEAACEAATMLAVTPPDRAAALAAFGRAYATAAQVTSDCQDVWGKDVSPDLANARPTPPVAYGLWAAPPEERAALRQRILAAGWDPEAQKVIRAALAQRGALAYCALRVRVLQGEARSALQRAGAADHPLLRFLVDRIWPWGGKAPEDATG